MAQQEIPAEGYTTHSGDRVFGFGEYVAFIYADQSPQFIKCDNAAEAVALFDLTRSNADKRGEVREVSSFAPDRQRANDDTLLTIEGWDVVTHLADDDVTTWCGIPNAERSIIAPSGTDRPTCEDCRAQLII
ncbi:hypothetical protein [Streptomyces sp. MJM1172]|uniref:hypothetical protein n=1 Tax=Streptomyces sp. MJM1172 TaxID=1703926 RepID=UPI00093B7842|nr:hypothetical protein [Streptomyces sp. MJM1172]OKI71388.1 hypothetical protein AMK15_01810 [Streptomyces sp. MJM1172]